MPDFFNAFDWIFWNPQAIAVLTIPQWRSGDVTCHIIHFSIKRLTIGGRLKVFQQHGCQFDIKRPDHVACLYVHYAFTSYQPRRDSFHIKETSGTYMSLLFISIIVHSMPGTPCILRSYTSLRHRQKTTPIIQPWWSLDGHFGIKYVIFGRRQPKLAHFEK